MSVEVLFVISAVIGIASKAFSKCCSNMIPNNSVSGFSMVLIINSIVACLFFFITGGFAFSLNPVIIWYSVIYAVVAAISIIANIIVYRYTSVSNVTVISNSCGMVATVMIGGLIFSENIGSRTVIRLAVMILAMVFVFLDQRKGARASRDDKRKNKWIPLVLTVAVITLAGCANTLVLKFFALSDSASEETSFFFFTNVFLCIGALVVFFVSSIRKKESFWDSVRLIKPGKLVFIAGNTVCSNISSIVTVLIVAQMDVSAFSLASSAIGILTGVIGSLIFREKQSIFAYIAAGISCVAIFI